MADITWRDVFFALWAVGTLWWLNAILARLGDLSMLIGTYGVAQAATRKAAEDVITTLEGLAEQTSLIHDSLSRIEEEISRGEDA